MTREFNKQWRDDSRPSFRNKSSNRDEERSSRTTRPRLSREIVDRGWESGAQQRHADYRPRSNNGQTPRNNWRSEHASARHDHNHGPYNKRQEGYQDTPRRHDRPHNSYQGSRPQTFGERRNFAEPRGEHRGYSDRQNNRPGSRNDTAARGHSGQPYQNQRYDNRRYNNERDRGPRDFGAERQNPTWRKRDRDRQQRGPDTQNPRWQSRPWTFGKRSFHETTREPFQGQFEGDYEWFDENDVYDESGASSSRGERRPSEKNGRGRQDRNHQHTGEEQERHVTRLPDGRVIKGSRPQQRQEARFWTDINEDTDSLLQHVQRPDVEDRAQQPTDEAERIIGIETANDTPRRQAKSAAAKSEKRATGASARRRKAAPSTKVASATRTPKPSQRGFKWPAP